MIHADYTVFDDMVRALYEAKIDGIVGEWGYLSGKPKYPDGTPVGKVAKIQEARTAFFTKALEQHQDTADKMAEVMEALMTDEKMDPVTAIKECVKLQAHAVVRNIESEGLVATGRLRTECRWKVKDTTNKGRAITGKGYRVGL
jgi:hypothetical protein